MKFNEEMLQAFNLESVVEKEPVNVMQVREMLDFMKSCSECIELFKGRRKLRLFRL